jgi:DNA-directed RNA polymerase subunit RPC12/RpoP
MEKHYKCVGCSQDFRVLRNPDSPASVQHEVEMNVECPHCSKTNSIVWPQGEFLPLVGADSQADSTYKPHLQISTPRINLLGVYKPDISARLYKQQRRVTGSEAKTEAHFRDLVLIEAVIEQIDDRFNMGDFGQSYARGDYKDHFQCAYDEALLSQDGKTVVERNANCVKGSGNLRFAFYLHFYDPRRPLRWSYGQVQCPAIEPISTRLQSLVPYRALT